MLILNQHVALTLYLKQDEHSKRVADAWKTVDIDDVHVRIKLITKEEKDRIIPVEPLGVVRIIM